MRHPGGGRGEGVCPAAGIGYPAPGNEPAAGCGWGGRRVVKDGLPGGQELRDAVRADRRHRYLRGVQGGKLRWLDVHAEDGRMIGVAATQDNTLA